MRKVITYARVSTDKQNNDRQRNDLWEICARNKWISIKDFEEKISGFSKMDERKLLWSIIDYARENDVECIVVQEVSRISREMELLHSFLNICKRNKISVYIQQLNMETLNPLDKTPNPMCDLLISIIGSIGRMEKEITLERMASGRREYIRKGGKVGRPKGKNSEDDMLLKHSDVKRLLVQGMSIRNASKVSGKSIYTIQKIKNILKKRELVS